MRVKKKKKNGKESGHWQIDWQREQMYFPFDRKSEFTHAFAIGTTMYTIHNSAGHVGFKR